MNIHNVIYFLEKNAQAMPDKPALIFNWQGLTFGELWDKVDRISFGLKKVGIEPGAKIVLMIPMSIDLYPVLLATLKLGAIAVFIDPWLGYQQIASFSALIKPKAYIGTPQSHLLRLLNRNLRQIPVTISTDSWWGKMVADFKLNEICSNDGDGQIYSVCGDTPALITFTSGSSGQPKGSNRTHKFLTAQHQALETEFPYKDTDRDMTMFPVFALNNLAMGISSIIPDMDFRQVGEVNPQVIVSQMIKQAVTTCTASPTFFNRLVYYLKKNPSVQLKLRRILTGGAPVTNRELLDWQRTLPHTEIIVVYGSTEAEPVAHIHLEERLALKEQSGICVGRIIDCLQAKIIKIKSGPIVLKDDNWAGWEIAQGEVGELAVSGENVCPSYYQNDQAMAENKIIDNQGKTWHRMGDTGYFDEGGYFWWVGRTHSTITRNGKQIHPYLIEQAIRKDFPDLGRLAVVGNTNHRNQEIILVLEAPFNQELKAQLWEWRQKSGSDVDKIIFWAKPLPVDPRHNAKIDYIRLARELDKTVKGA